jgi:AcrR family transcriptional regulator
VPTGVAFRDAREQLFAAAERVMLREGPNALTSRAVTTEAGCAKGVLHRHFTDFDGFLIELVADRVKQIDAQAAALTDAAGTGTVADNVTDALMTVFGAVALSIVGLMTFRDDLRARLRANRPRGIPVLTEAADMLTAYLTAERDLGRVTADADVYLLALTLIGSGHMVFVGRDGVPPDPAAVHDLVTSILTGALR